MIQNLISKLQGNPHKLAKFLNTLSMLEYIGARKILKSQDQISVTLDVLSHAAEEIRHAQYLKKVALRMSDGELTSYREEHLLGGREAQNYIQGIDYGVQKTLGLKQESTNYLLTTLLLEERANSLYPLLEELMSQSGIPGIFKTILREETLHLNAVKEALETPEPRVPSLVNDDQLIELRKMEDLLFQSFMKSLIEAP